MQLTIGGREYTLLFDFNFLTAINKLKPVQAEGLNFGVGGMQLLTVGLNIKDPETVKTVIKAATDYLGSKPSDKDIVEFIYELSAGDDYDAFFDEVQSEIKKDAILLRAMNQAAEKKATVNSKK